ncbi:MAG: xanthine dehydrogenase family protein molybdopterin-binding subunit, partial [Bryobacteraceae bacterium]
MIGRPVPRKEGRDKVTGRALYVDDVSLPGMLYGVTVRSPVAHGVIRAIRYDVDLPWNEIVVATAADIPGENVVATIVDDQPLLASGIVNHPEEPLVLLAHADRTIAEKARAAVRFEIDPLPPEEPRVLKSYLVEKGNVDEVWARADHVVEGEYETGAQEQLYIEPQGMIAMADPESGVTVRGSMQCPYYVHKALKRVFGLPDGKVRVVQMETGGGFGGKEEYPSIIAAHAALLAWKSGRPVKIVYDRAEDM